MNNSSAKEFFKQHYSILFYLLFGVLIITAISQKQYFYTEEYGSYSLSNTVEARAPIFTNAVLPRSLVFDNLKYTPASEFYAKLMCVQPGREFDYKNMIDNSIDEPHPLMQYVLLHTISSFFPGVFSKWFAGVINLVFALLLLFVSRKLLDLLLEDRRTADILSLMLVFSAAIVTSTAFLRMYVMAMFATTLEGYMLLKQVRKPITNKFCMQLFAVTLLGAHIHHYCTLFAVLMSVAFAIYLLCDKDIAGLCKFCLAQISSGIVACMIFPPMLSKILRSAMHNNAALCGVTICEVASFSDGLMVYLRMINEELFGGAFFVIVVAMCYLAIRNAKENNKTESVLIAHRRYVMIFTSVFIYVLFVCYRNMRWSFTQLELDFRYVQPVWILLLVGCLSYLITNAKKYTTQKFMNIAVPVLAILITLGGWHYVDIDGRYIYRGFAKYDYIRRPYYNADCICFTGDAISFYVSYELQPYKSLTWIKLPKFNPAQLEEFKKKDKLVICIQLPDVLADKVFVDLMKFLPMFEAKTKLPLFANLPDFECPGNIYYLSKVLSK